MHIGMSLHAEVSGLGSFEPLFELFLWPVAQVFARGLSDRVGGRHQFSSCDSAQKCEAATPGQAHRATAAVKFS